MDTILCTLGASGLGCQRSSARKVSRTAVSRQLWLLTTDEQHGAMFRPDRLVDHAAWRQVIGARANAQFADSDFALQHHALFVVMMVVRHQKKTPGSSSSR